MGFNQIVYAKLGENLLEYPVGLGQSKADIICSPSMIEHSESLHLSTVVSYEFLH